MEVYSEYIVYGFVIHFYFRITQHTAYTPDT